MFDNQLNYLKYTLVPGLFAFIYILKAWNNFSRVKFTFSVKFGFHVYPNNLKLELKFSNYFLFLEIIIYTA